MIGSDMGMPPFDVFSLSEDVRERFGWSNDDLSKVMEQLLPAALNGFRYFGSAVPGFAEFPGVPASFGSDETSPLSSFMQNASGTALTPFFGPEAVQNALAAQISGLTGLQSDAIQEMMPVAATLAMGQVARPFLQGEARNLLDAYLRGFARGRPKPQPTPVDYMQGYADAMTAFWGSFLQPASVVSQPAEHVADPEPEEDLPEDDDDVAEEQTSEFDEMVSSWMAAGRDFQSNQFRAFDSFFEKAARDLDEDK